MESQTAQAVLEALHQEGQAIRREALSILEALLYIGSGAQQGWPEEAKGGVGMLSSTVRNLSYRGRDLDIVFLGMRTESAP